MEKSHLIIGKGEVGKALYNVLKKHLGGVIISIIDKNEPIKNHFNVLHICYPYSEKFIKITKNYIKTYKPKLVIIHSTIKMGTTEKIGRIAVHSPIRGGHPYLEKSIITFVKYFAGSKAKQASGIFSRFCQIKCYKDPKITELAKLLCTTYYSWDIVFNKEVKKICDKEHLPFSEVYTEFNNSYNEGYEKLGKLEVIRPVLKFMKGKIGGHCIIPNCYFLNNKLTKFIINYNKKL